MAGPIDPLRRLPDDRPRHDDRERGAAVDQERSGLLAGQPGVGRECLPDRLCRRLTAGRPAGGIITQAVSWHWIFFVNLPIGVLIAVLASRMLDSERGLGFDQGADSVGAFLVTAGLMLGVYAIVQSSEYGLASAHTLGFGGVAVILLVAFVVRQATARNPLLPLRLFGSRNLSASNVIQAIGGVAMFGFFFMGSLDMQRVL